VEAAPLKVEVSAESAILINAETGRVLFEKNSHALCYPASTTKIATALYTLTQAGDDLDNLVEAEREAIASISPSQKKKANYRNPAYWIEVGSNHVGIKKGEIMPLKDLMYAMMLASANDAANVIAQYIGGTISGFVKQMNEYLVQIGCQDTNFMNPHGLHHPDHYTTASDLAKIARDVIKYPFFREVVSTFNYVNNQTNKQPSRTFVQTTKLLKKNSPYYYQHAIAAKRGYTTDSLHTLVAAAQYGDRNLIAVVLKCPEHKDIYMDASRLFDAAFNERKETKRVLAKGPQVYTQLVEGASSKLETTLAEDIYISYYPSEEPTVKANLIWDSLIPPLAKHQQVGLITLTSNDGHYKKVVPLLAKEEVKPTIVFSIKKQMKTFSQNNLLIKGAFVSGIVLLLSGIAFWVLCKRYQH